MSFSCNSTSSGSWSSGTGDVLRRLLVFLPATLDVVRVDLGVIRPVSTRREHLASSEISLLNNLVVDTYLTETSSLRFPTADGVCSNNEWSGTLQDLDEPTASCFFGAHARLFVDCGLLSSSGCSISISPMLSTAMGIFNEVPAHIPRRAALFRTFLTLGSDDPLSWLLSVSRLRSSLGYTFA
jgi:hypothetical protein